MQRIAEELKLLIDSDNRIIILDNDDYHMTCLNTSDNALISSDNDVVMYKNLICAVRKYPMHMGTIARANNVLANAVRDRSYMTAFILRFILKDWILAKTPLLDDPDFKYHFSTRCVWIFNGMSEFKRCRVDGNLIGVRKNIKLSQQYGDHCCQICASRDPIVKKRIASTTFEHFGANSFF